MMLINRLFKGLAVVLTVMGGIVIIWFLVNLVDLTISASNLEGSSFSRGFSFVILAKRTQRNLILVLIASAVEIALFWLLVLLDVVSRHRGLIATLILFIFVGIVVFIVYSQYLNAY
ncbi:hypothetical protein NIES4072_06760 [Nostoc commune NIES-4072]|uniref:Uncharacterized protein n=1 Tax=Nostoc commune NIES-4072 TaxID=2005467 RepID=A0A2R5FI36_NOSCO|nr:hypothetical protein [Nostoc commune]BBD65648.1 hypothetical protein NIES4070_20070 [Nostoc commune HK-02]GBG17028.1 hypothetical protein NIES4072_06760 [Nostoc commune NIES-4072]